MHGWVNIPPVLDCYRLSSPAHMHMCILSNIVSLLLPNNVTRNCWLLVRSKIKVSSQKKISGNYAIYDIFHSYEPKIVHLPLSGEREAKKTKTFIGSVKVPNS